MAKGKHFLSVNVVILDEYGGDKGTGTFIIPVPLQVYDQLLRAFGFTYPVSLIS